MHSCQSSSILGLLVALVLLSTIAQPPVVDANFWGIFSENNREESMRKEYDKINDYLADYMSDDDSSLEILKKVKLITEDAPKKTRDNSRIIVGQYRLLRSAMVQLASLIDLYDSDPKCGPYSLNLLLNNDKYTRIKITDKPDIEIPRRKLESLLKTVAEDHAFQCRYAYPRILQEIKKEPHNVRPFKEVKTAMNAVIASNTKRVFYNRHRPMDKRALLKEMARTITDMRSKEQAVPLVFFIRAQTDDKPEHKYLYPRSDPKKTGKWFLDTNKVLEVTTKYLFDPCDHYIRVTKEVLEPAEFDQQLVGFIKRYRGVSEELLDLMIGLEYFRLCKRILNEDREELLENMEKIIWDPDYH